MESMKELYNRVTGNDLNYFRYVNVKGSYKVKSEYYYNNNEMVISYNDGSEGRVKLSENLFRETEKIRIDIKEETQRILLQISDITDNNSYLFCFEK